MSKDEKQSARPPGHLEREETKLWRLALLFLVLLATGLAALSWERLENLPYHLGVIPVGLLVMAILFATYAYGRRREVSELRHLLQNLQERAGATPSEEQLDQLSQVILRSQRSFKELIDSIDDVACAVSLDGTLRTVNRRITELLGTHYTEVVGHKMEEFIGEPQRHDVDPALGRFLEKRRWSGMVRVRLKKSSRVLYFDCVLNAIVKGDEVVGISTLARDVTEEREKERRFTQLFETLQEGVYFSTPEGKLLDANPALVGMLGYHSREELLGLPPAALNVEADQEPVLGRAGSQTGSTRTREIRVKRRDGSVAVCVDTSTGVIESGRIVRYQGTLVDVTEKRTMERQLRRQEEFRRHLLESFPDLILVLDPKATYTFVSSRIRDLLGYGPEQLMGKKIEEVTDNSPELVALYRSVANGQQALATSEYG